MRTTDYARFIKTLDLPPGFAAPTRLAYEDLVAVAITRADLRDDVRGINASLELIRRTRGGDWPTEPVTEAFNFVDLVWHELEFREGASFTYVIRDADGGYVGCAYLYPMGRRTELTEALDAYDVDVSWWVTPDAYERGRYETLHRALRHWLADEFPFWSAYYSNAEIPVQEIVTERLLLRPFRADDLPAFVAYRSQADIARYQSWDTSYSMADAELFLAEQRAVVLGEPGAWVQLAAIERAGGALCGDCAVRVLADQPATAEIGVTLAPERQGRGLAAEALAAVLDHLFGEHGLHRIYAETDERNGAVHRLLERLGLRCEARLVEADRFKGEWSSLRIYAILHREWEARPPELRGGTRPSSSG